MIVLAVKTKTNYLQTFNFLESRSWTSTFLHKPKMSPYSFKILPVLRVVRISPLITMSCLVYTLISDPCLSLPTPVPHLNQACWYVIEFYRVFSAWNDFLKEYSCRHLTVYILVGERDTNKSFLWICFSCHFTENNGTNPCKNNVWRNSISNLI